MKGDFTNMSIDLDLNLQNLAGNLGVPDHRRPAAACPTRRSPTLPDQPAAADPADPARPPAAPRHAQQRHPGSCPPVIGCPLGAPAEQSGSSRRLVALALRRGCCMIRRSVQVQLFAFLLITLLTVSVLSARYVGLYDRVAGGQYHVTADFEQSGGIFVGSEVSYRGVTVGRRRPTCGCRRTASSSTRRSTRGVTIPKDTKVVVENRSARGRAVPRLPAAQRQGPRRSTDGDAIPRKDTAYPLRRRHAPARPRPDRELGRQAGPARPSSTSWARASPTAARTSSGCSTAATP